MTDSPEYQFIGDPKDLESIAYDGRHAFLTFTLPIDEGQVLVSEAEVEGIPLNQLVQGAIQYANIDSQIDGYRSSTKAGIVHDVRIPNRPDYYPGSMTQTTIAKLEAIAVMAPIGKKLEQLARTYDTTYASIIYSGLLSRRYVRQRRSSGLIVAAMRTRIPTVLLAVS